MSSWKVSGLGEDGVTGLALRSCSWLLALSSKPQGASDHSSPTAWPEPSRLIHDCNGSRRQPSVFAAETFCTEQLDKEKSHLRPYPSCGSRQLLGMNGLVHF